MQSAERDCAGRRAMHTRRANKGWPQAMFFRELQHSGKRDVRGSHPSDVKQSPQASGSAKGPSRKQACAQVEESKEKEIQAGGSVVWV